MDGVDKLANFFDIQRAGRDTDVQFRQKVKSCVDYFQHKNQEPVIKPITKSLSELSYEVCGYDKDLENYMAERSVELKRIPLGTKVKATDLLKTQLAKFTPPRTYVDGQGNIWKIVV